MSKVRLYGDTSGFVDLKAPDVAGDVTITLPNTTGPFATETYVDSEIAAIPEIAGIGSNVVSAHKTDVFSTTATAYTDVTDLTVTITPTSATSKIMLIAQVNLGAAGESTGLPRVRLNGGNADAHVGDAGGTSTAAGFGGMATTEQRNYSAGLGISSIIAYLDSPATTSATTYTVQLASSGGGTVRVNQGGAYRSASSITAIEVAA